MDVEALLQSIPPLMVYLVVGAVVGIESLGIPLPGEIVLVSAAVLSSHPELAVNPIGVGGAAVIGAVGRRFDRLLDRPPLRLTAIRPAGPEVPKTLRPRSCRAC